MVAAQETVLVGVDGGTGSGKTTSTTWLAAYLRGEFRVPVDVVLTDRIFRPVTDRWSGAFDDMPVGYDVDWERIRDDVLLPLRVGNKACFQLYDWAADALGPWVDIEADQVRQYCRSEPTVLGGIQTAWRSASRRMPGKRGGCILNVMSRLRIASMSWKAVIIGLAAGTLVFSGFAVAQEAGSEEVASNSRWSVGTSLTYPIARIYQAHINYRLGETSEVFFGPAYQNFQSGSITSNAYTLIVGYRHRLWRDLHGEIELWPAWNRMHSSVTETYYPGWELWAEMKVGYTFHLTRNLYIHAAPGIGLGIFRTNPPPRFKEDLRSPNFAPQLILGWRF